MRDREVKIQEFDYEGWELIETPNRSKFTIDFSMLKHPENSYFLGGDAKGFDPNKKYDIALLSPQKISYCDFLNGVRFGHRYGFSDITG